MFRFVVWYGLTGFIIFVAVFVIDVLITVSRAPNAGVELERLDEKLKEFAAAHPDGFFEGIATQALTFLVVVLWPLSLTFWFFLVVWEGDTAIHWLFQKAEEKFEKEKKKHGL